MHERRKEPHWFLLIVATAVTEGIVQLLISHVDIIATWIRFGLTGIIAEVVSNTIPVILTIAIIMTVIGFLRTSPHTSSDTKKENVKVVGPIERLL